MTIKAAFESTPGSTFNDYRNHPVTPADASKRVAEILRLRLWGKGATQEYPLNWMMEVICPPEGPLKQTITLAGPRETEAMDLLLGLLIEEFHWRQVGEAKSNSTEIHDLDNVNI